MIYILEFCFNDDTKKLVSFNEDELTNSTNKMIDCEFINNIIECGEPQKISIGNEFVFYSKGVIIPFSSSEFYNYLQEKNDQNLLLINHFFEKYGRTKKHN